MGLLVATDDELWRVGPDKATRVPELARVRIVDARLASEVGLVLLEHGGEILILDAAEGRLVTRLGSVQVVDAAFAPDGKRVALATADEVLIHSIGATEPALRWKVDGVGGLAWRQDGAALMTGATRARPDRLWSLDSHPSALLVDFSKLDGAAWTVDPSWRFAADDDGTFLRTLDLVTLSLVDRASFTDTGLFDGSVEDLDDWRLVLVEHPDWGAHRFGELSALVHHPNLAADFFAGLSLPSPETPSHKPSGGD